MLPNALQDAGSHRRAAAPGQEERTPPRPRTGHPAGFARRRRTRRRQTRAEAGAPAPVSVRTLLDSVDPRAAGYRDVRDSTLSHAILDGLHRPTHHRVPARQLRAGRVRRNGHLALRHARRPNAAVRIPAQRTAGRGAVPGRLLRPESPDEPRHRGEPDAQLLLHPQQRGRGHDSGSAAWLRLLYDPHPPAGRAGRVRGRVTTR